MRRILLTLASFSPLVLLPVACAVEEEPQDVEVVETREDEIIGGTADTTNKAVVWLYDEQGSACSGTVVAKNGSTAWVLTAAHCQGMDWAVQANDYNGSWEAYYEVIADQAHNQWNGDVTNGYDFRILTINGAANAPVIPYATSPDGVSNGASIEAVGYGITPGQNSLRRHVVETVADYDSFFIVADQTDGTGTCSGDSGGPILLNGKVVGVTSFGDQNCTQVGYYGRVTLVANWIAGITGGVVMPNCNDCSLSATQSNGACGNQWSACVNNQDCVDLLNCFDGCSTDQCYNDCANQHPTGTNLYSAAVTCICEVGCVSECATECGGGSSSSSTGSGPGPGATTSATTGSGSDVGGGNEGGATGEGGSTTSGGGKKKKKSADNEEDTEEGSSCAVAAPGTSSDLGLVGLGGLGLLAGAVLRRRRR